MSGRKQPKQQSRRVKNKPGGVKKTIRRPLKQSSKTSKNKRPSKKAVPGPSKSSTAQFRPGHNKSGGFKSFDQITHVGFINDPLDLGLLTSIIDDENRVVFEFQLNKIKFDAWSSKKTGWAQKNMEKLKIGHQYILQGTMKAEHVSIKFNRSTNSTFKFSLLLSEINVVKEELIEEPNSTATPSEPESFQKINQRIESCETFTKAVKDVKILGGEVRRYMGCDTCYSGIPEPNKRHQVYCKLCKSVTKRRVCIIIRNLKLEDKYGGILEKAICFHQHCLVLFNGEPVMKQLCCSSSDLLAREKFESLLGTLISATIKYQGPTGSQKKAFNFHKLIVEKIHVQNYTQTPQVEPENSRGARIYLEPERICCCCDEDDNENESNNENYADTSKDNYLKSTQNQSGMSLKDLRKDLDPDNFYRMVPNKSGWTGLAIIINMTVNRNGSEKDVIKLSELFPKLGVKIFRNKALQDINKYEFDDAVEEFKDELVRGEYSSFFFVFMCHGSMYNVRLHDGTRLNVYKDILPLFGEKSFAKFSGKPKIFIFNACQHFPLLLDTDALNDYCRSWNVDDTQCILNTLECYPCEPGVKAKRNKFTGSHFIQTLASVIEMRWKETDMEEMFKEVQNRMKDRRFGASETSINIPVYKPMVFSRRFYFWERESSHEEPMEED